MSNALLKIYAGGFVVSDSSLFREAGIGGCPQPRRIGQVWAGQCRRFPLTGGGAHQEAVRKDCEAAPDTLSWDSLPDPSRLRTT